MREVLKLLPFVKPYRKQALAALALLSMLVLMDLSIPRLVQRIIDRGIFGQDQRIVIETAFVMLGISGLGTVFALGNNSFSIRAGEGAARDLRAALFEKIQSFSFGNLDRMKTSELLTRLTSDVNSIKTLVQISLRIGTRAPLMMAGSLVLMTRTNSGLALMMMPVLAVTTGILLFFILRMEPLFLGIQQRLDRLNTVLRENIAGIRLVKAFVRGPSEEMRFEKANRDLTGNSRQVMRFLSWMAPSLALPVNVGVVLVLWAGGFQAAQGNMTTGQVVAFANYLLTTMTPLVMMGMLSNVWASGIASARRINEILDTVPDVMDSPGAGSLPGHGAPRIEFQGVCFSYDGDCAEPVLQGIDLVVREGETVAFLGSTGSGKSTLVNLVPRFYDVTAGQILIEGTDIRDLRQDLLLGQIAVVPQETILFTGTISDNIRLGRPEASDEEVVEAAKAAQAHDFIVRSPSGYDSHVEQRGVNLSGGQKQRVAIARALLRKPRLLILDDSTSSVDVETEGKIQDAIGKLDFPHTTLIVAQRVSTVLKADRIVVIEDGRIAASGSHEELMGSSPAYREIYASQLGGGMEEQGALSAREGNPS